MTKLAFCGVGLAVVAAAPVFCAAQDAASASDQDLSGHKRTIQRYCVTCHDAKRNTANVNLEVLNFEDVREHGELWEKMVHKVRTGDMPPPGKRQPSRRNRRTLLEWMVTSLDQAALEQSPVD